jgi:hypothetical protein
LDISFGARGETLDIFASKDGSGAADSAAQDAWCANVQKNCVISRIYDQSPMKNDLTPAPAGGAGRTPDSAVNASAHAIMIYGNKRVYGAKFEGGMGYRNDKTKGVAVGDEPETMYAVFNGKHFNNKCCFDYGNAETNNLDMGKGTMEAVYFGNSNGWGKGALNGPWVMADLENGLWAGKDKVNEENKPIDADFVTAMLKGDTNNHFSLKGSKNGFAGWYRLFDGPRPERDYQVMRKQGAIILGIGGDNSKWAVGTFYEGVMTKGYSTDEADNLVQSNIAAANYTLIEPMFASTSTAAKYEIELQSRSAPIIEAKPQYV